MFLHYRSEWRAILQTIESREYQLRHLDYLHGVCVIEQGYTMSNELFILLLFQLLTNLNKLPPLTPCLNGQNQLHFVFTCLIPAMDLAIEGRAGEAQKQVESFCLTRLNVPR